MSRHSNLEIVPLMEYQHVVKEYYKYVKHNDRFKTTLTHLNFSRHEESKI